MKQDEDFNLKGELLDEDQDNELFYNFGDFEESQDLEYVNVVLIITCIPYFVHISKTKKYLNTKL